MINAMNAFKRVASGASGAFGDDHSAVMQLISLSRRPSLNLQKLHNYSITIYILHKFNPMPALLRLRVRRVHRAVGRGAALPSSWRCSLRGGWCYFYV